MDKDAMAHRIEHDPGYLAALDQSGGSTPKALATYGLTAETYATPDAMFALMHEMRCRIMTAPAFSGEQVLGAILFDRTMDGTVEGMPVPAFLWQKKRIVPFVKIDQGLEAEAQGVQMMRPMAGLEALLERAAQRGVYGTKARSVIHTANSAGVSAVVQQQIVSAKRVLDAGLTPILEPEVSVKSSDKEDAERMLRDALLEALDIFSADEAVVLKLTLPEQPNFYDVLIQHPRVQRVVALSGGYSLDEACQRLTKNKGIIASFSRALLDRLRVSQSDEAFNAALQQVSDRIYDASVNKVLS